MRPIGENIWIKRFELQTLGLDIGRTVTAIKLKSGDVVIHSTAPFTDKDVNAIRAIGPVKWILDPMLDHDTFSEDGKKAFPEATFLAPRKFPRVGGEMPTPIIPAPEAWQDDIAIIPLHGAPSFGEHVFYHIPSKTLIVCDLLFNFPEVDSTWEKVLLHLGLGPHKAPGISRRLKFSIKDGNAFQASVARIMEWDFEQIVVGHGEPITENARARAREAFESAHWLEPIEA